MGTKFSCAAIMAAWFSLYLVAATPWTDDRPKADSEPQPGGEGAIEGEARWTVQPPAPGGDGRGDRDARQSRRGSGRWWWRDAEARQRSHPDVLAAFRPAVLPTKAATVRIMVDGQPAALGAIVEPDGQIVSKASLLEGKITCRLPDGRELQARLLGADEENDLALLKVEAQDLTPVSWRPGGVPPVGSWVATVGQQADPLAIGVVSAEPRTIPGPRRAPPRRGVLGVSLGQADTGPRIEEVVGGSAAEKAGLKVGDIVHGIDGKPLTTVQQMIEAVGSHPPGEKITLLIERDEDELRLTATLEKPQADPRRQPAPEDGWGGGPFSQRRYGFPSAMPHDTVLRPTDCGGPLVDTDGKVVGINIARALRVTSYAIPADVARKVVAELKKKAPSD